MFPHYDPRIKKMKSVKPVKPVNLGDRFSGAAGKGLSGIHRDTLIILLNLQWFSDVICVQKW